MRKILLLAAIACAVPAYAWLEQLGTEHILRMAEDDCALYRGAGRLVSVTREGAFVRCTYKTPSALWL